MKNVCRRGPLKVFLALALAWLLFSTPAQAFRFAFFADSRNCPGIINETAIADILQQIKKVSDEENGNPIDFIIFGGDMACQGGKNNLVYWKNYVTLYLPSSNVTLFVAKGNHELYGPKKTDAVRQQLDDEYKTVFSPPTPAHPCPTNSAAFSFEHGSNNTCLLVVLDTYEDLKDQSVRAYISPQQLAWLQGEVKKTTAVDHPGKTFVHKFVFGHCPVKPLSTQENHKWENYPDINTDLASTLEKGLGVRAYFCGHEHTYKDFSPLVGKKGHSYGFKQLIVGNGGANDHGNWNFEVVDVVSPNQVKYSSYLGKDGNYTKKTVIENYP